MKYKIGLMDPPRLIENGMSQFMYDTLKNCHHNRVKTYSTALNVGIFIFFILIVGWTLYCCYRKKPTEAEIRAKMLRDQEYVLSKIRFYQEESHKMQTPIKNTNTALRTLL